MTVMSLMSKSIQDKISQINVNRINWIERFCLPLKTVSVEFYQKTVRSKREISCISEIIFAVLNTEVVVNHVCWPSSDPSKRYLNELYVLAYRSRVFTRLEYGEFRWLSALLLSEWNNPSL